MKKIIITIDGVAGSGKGTTAQGVANYLGYVHIDSGATYRAVALYFLRYDVKLDDKQKIFTALQDISIRFFCDEKTGENMLFLNDENVEREIRKQYISDHTFHVAQLQEVRNFLDSLNQELGKNKGIVMDGRDIGKKVFPHAELKIYLTADLMKRAERRRKQLQKKGDKISLEEVKKHLKERDTWDQNNTYQCVDAIEIDTTNLTIENQIEQVVNLAKKILNT